MPDRLTAAWIFPVDQRCGISFYAQAYVNALSEYCRIMPVDPARLGRKDSEVVRVLKNADIVHVQYETSLFFSGRRDFFPRLRAIASRPIVVSLHEVYRTFPWMFPRESIRGSGCIRWLKLKIYDMRHPYAAAFDRHCKAWFAAQKILVHSQCHKEILAEKGVPLSLMNVMPHPVKDRYSGQGLSWEADSVIHLGATGFINLSYDYNLLFETLSNIKRPWRFTWIGGLRRDNERGLLERIKTEIRRRGCENRFEITGWVDDSRRDELLGKLHVFCALFTNRSSSESLATAIGARCRIVATRHPFIEEINRAAPVVACVEPAAGSVAAAIERICSDDAYRRELQDGCARYAREFSFDSMAARVMREYHLLAGEKNA